MFRTLLASASTYLTSRLRLVVISATATSGLACTALPAGAPPPHCSLSHCDTKPGPDEILTGPGLTRGWTFGRREDGALLIGKWQDKPTGHAIVEFNAAQTALKELSVSLDGATSRVPSHVLECISGTTPDKIGWVFSKTDNPKWGGSLRHILIGFKETRAKPQSNQPIKLDDQSHISISFNGDQLMRIDYHVANGSLISASGNTGCAHDLVPEH